MTTTTTTLPTTFWSQAALAAAVDAVFADALAAELAPTLTDAPVRPAVVLPTLDILLAQAGIVTGPSAPDPRTPSRTAHLAKAGGRLAGRAAWWLLKAAVYATAVILREIIVTSWHLFFGTDRTRQASPARPAGRAMLPSDFLTATSQHITAAGWTRFTRQAPGGAVCVLGAERVLLRTGSGTPDTAARANAHLLQVTGARTVPGFNDGLTRRESQIHAALLNAAARARAAGE
ncbi:hypothetical protein QMK19_36295 [Streptomyces sp. H10-C2]|uniref:DUF6197 family protein n=1 Tax=unclassified Streptomyces TaxID=2593676 RepID=UPI0022AF1EBB|nr:MULTISPECIES: hypothetical protein [unclassified Streptomyces]MCZ4102654.1 hypothetical protein [Streptomyces sp. H39-C1]MDJ0346376.1 hypothetical protein [Streptomyces sp. PH10-H1]MDJ0374934.1 hypothetical protein [Streptomyces sp. H10-C2]